MAANHKGIRLPRLLRRSMLAKLVVIQLITVAVIVLIAWVMLHNGIQHLFSQIMEQYNIDPVEPTQEFTTRMRLDLVTAAGSSLVVGIIISMWLHRSWIGDLLRLRNTAQQVMQGEYVQARVQSGDEIGQLGAAINAMSQSLQRIEQERRELLIDVAHELRTPLTSMKGYLDAMTDEIMPATPATLRLLAGEVHRLQSLVESIHRLNTLEYGRDPLPLEAVDLYQLVLEMWSLFVFKFAEAGMDHELNADPATPIWVEGHRDLLVQILYNVLDNAWRYGHADDSVRAVLSTPSVTTVQLTIENRGDQIAAVAVDKIFNRFYRGESSRSRKTGGIGVGLAIVHKAVSMHHGEVWAESGAGRFALTLQLPRMAGATDRTESATVHGPGHGG